MLLLPDFALQVLPVFLLTQIELQEYPELALAECYPKAKEVYVSTAFILISDTSRIVFALSSSPKIDFVGFSIMYLAFLYNKITLR